MGKKESASVKAAEQLAMHEIVAVAAYMAGAATKTVDTEDIAYKANEIAPGQFTWKKHKDQINIELVYKHLWDLTKLDKGEYVSGNKNDGWMLTAAGTAFAEKSVERLDGAEQKMRRPQKEEAWIKRERARMQNETAYEKFMNGKPGEITVREAEKFFRIDDYIVGEGRQRKIRQAENVFQGDPKMGAAVSKIATIARNGK